jgi:hypothetical protein
MELGQAERQKFGQCEIVGRSFSGSASRYNKQQRYGRNPGLKEAMESAEAQAHQSRSPFCIGVELEQVSLNFFDRTALGERGEMSQDVERTWTTE